MGNASAGSANDTYAVGKRLVELCQQGKNLQAVDELYAKDVESIEVFGDEKMPREMRGIDAVRGKNQWWFDNHEIHSATASGPLPHGDRFIVYYTLDVTPKPGSGPMAGQRMQMAEAGLYTVRGGKVVKEEFFYHMG